jgi:cephalosporin hydroxylase
MSIRRQNLFSGGVEPNKMKEDFFKDLIKKGISKVKGKFIDPELVDKFHNLYYDSGFYQFTEWEGIRIYKYPSDLFIYQEIIFRNKPDIIIETGTLYGGSAVFMARLLDIIGNGKVISIDNVKRRLPAHKRVKFIISNSIDKNLIKKIKKECIGKKVMVILDSDHHKEHVLKEMQLYAPLVSKGQYLIVEDGCVNGHPVYTTFGYGPYEAVQEFMKKDVTFKLDTKIENKFLLTQNTHGFLLKTK